MCQLEGSDYEGIPGLVLFTFQAGATVGDVECVNVTIINDAAVEDEEEQFTVQFIIFPPFMSVGSMVTIMEDPTDSES